MTNFERTYLMSRPRYIAVEYNDGSGRASEVIDITKDPITQKHNELAMQMQYRDPSKSNTTRLLVDCTRQAMPACQ